MKRHVGMIVLAALVVLALLTSTVAYKVDELKDIVLIKRFGAVDRVLYGSDAGQAGLRFKWPWPVEKLVRYNASKYIFEDPYVETSTRDKQNILVSMYCTWEIRDAVTFHQAVETVETAQERIRDRLRQRKSAVLSSHDMTDLINTDPARMKLASIEDEILKELKVEVEGPYGVRIGLVNVKVLGLPEQVASAVIDAQKQERQQYVQQYKGAAEALANAIRERAKSASSQIIEFAKRKAADIETEGVRAAAELYGKFQECPELSMFLRSLDSLKVQLQGKSVVILDEKANPAVRFFREGPSLSVFPTTQPGKRPASQPTAGGGTK
jgi:membrane protease subunit HflC